MIKVFCNDGNGEVEYTKYVVPGSISVQRNLNQPTTLSISFTNIDRVFTLPVPRSYIRIVSTLYNRSLFTGLLTADANYTYLAPSSAGAPPSPAKGHMFQYGLTYTSDEYLLNLKTTPFIPAFVNQTQGHILQTIAETLCPGFFDYSNIASGQLVPYQAYDYTKSWSEYAQTFAQNSNYRYMVVDKQIHFQPYNDGPLGIVYDETAADKLFDPNQLQQSSITTPIVNDVLMVGSQEPGNNHEDYFMGDGFTGGFALRHQVYNAGGQSGDSQSGSGSIVLADAWSENAFQTNVWNIQDPDNNFTLVDGALNIVASLQLQYGESYIQAVNGIELAGGVIIQHGEFVFNNTCTGLVGGVYDDATLNPTTCEAGYQISSETHVVVTASGAAGVLLQPFRLGGIVNNAFAILSEINHTYVLSTIIASPAPVRYTQVYNTIAGVVFGGESLSPNVVGNITWQVQDTNIFTGFIQTSTFTLSGCNLPSYAVYGLINNKSLNLSVQSTQIYTPPLGTLNVCSEVGAGLLQPIYVSGNQQYIGAYTTPSGGNLPILPDQIGPEQQWPLGASLQNQTAEIDLGTLTSTLNFYSNDLPGVGTRIRLQTWESQAAISRVQSQASIQEEANVVGDDGIRSAIVTNAQPIPRTSEDCDNAAAAYIYDRIGNFYQGTYTASYRFFKQASSDLEFYPVPGRFLYINSPPRGINKEFMLVSAVTTTVTEMQGEIMDHAISFGPVLQFELVSAEFISQPPNVLIPVDTVVAPTPQQLAQVGTTYLPDVVQSKFTTLSITGTTVNLELTDTIPYGSAWYEMRSADLNWGSNDNYLLGRFNGPQDVTIQRASFEQVWYLRFVYLNPGTGAIQTSRRSKVLRLYWPQVPSTPAYLYADSSTINCDFSGDIRNIEGIELRDGESDSIVYYDGIVGSEFDMMLNLDSLRGTISAGASVIGGPVGSYMKGIVPTGLAQSLTSNALQGTNNGAPGSTAWTNPQYAPNSGAALYAAANGSGSAVSFQGLQVQGFDFQGIPLGAIPNGIVISFQGGFSAGNGSITVQLANATGGFIGLPKTVTNPAWVTEIPLGGAGDLWNGDFQISDMQNLQVIFTATVTNGTAIVNNVQATVYFTAYQRAFNVHFFNLMWEYSPALYVYIPPPPTPTITEGYRWGPALQICMSFTARTDILYSTLQLSTDSASFTNGTAVPSGSFNIPGGQSIFYQAQTNGAVAAFAVNVTVTGDIYARAQFVDHISSGGWSTILHIPQGNLIASDYLSAQGSVPPAITNGDLGSGGIIGYQSVSTFFTGNSQPFIQIASASFSIAFPNGNIFTVPSTFRSDYYPLDTPGVPLQYATQYGYFAYVLNPTGPAPNFVLSGPWTNFTGACPALAIQNADGSVPLTNGAFIAQTAGVPPSGGNSFNGGGGGGTAGGNCAVSSRHLHMYNGTKRQLKDCTPGMMVKTPSGKGSKIKTLELFSQLVTALTTESGLETECARGHVLRDGKKGMWISVEDIFHSLLDDEEVNVWTEKNERDKVAQLILLPYEKEICRIELEDEHIYMVDGMWSHNVIVKNG